MSGSRTSSGVGNSQMPFDFTKLRNNISRNLQEVVNDTINSESVMDFRKMLKKNCNSCGSEFTSFALFKNKRCETCTLNYCTRCMFTTKTPRKCRRCLIFNQNPLTKEGLNTLRVRDLKWYLAQKNISVATYLEKGELVELIILNVRRPSARRNNNSNSNETRSSFSHNNTGPIPFRDAPERASFSEPTTHSSSVPPSPTGVFNAFGSTSQGPTTASPNLNDQDTPTSSNTNTIPPADSSSSVDSTAQQQPRSNLTSTTAASTPNLSSAETIPKFEPFNLDDITQESDIHGLSIRQLKVVLARNYVDFRGCVEKDELVQRTIRLWNDHQGRQKYIEENEDNLEIDADACKICMVRPIDCVLLECGHMVTCTQCGKQLPECPICRQFISRVVHVFKS